MRLLAVVTCALVFVGALAPFAGAQWDFFGGGGRSERSNSDRSRGYDGFFFGRSDPDRWNDSDSDRNEPREQRPRRAAPSQQRNGTYCVRTCDGFYFPLSSGQNGNAQALCQSLCPAAKTEVYTRRGESMDQAYSRSGQAYSKLPAAFAYRKSVSPDCSCRARDKPALSVTDDPTLRAGDLVVTETGVSVFRGNSSVPHKERDFVDFRGAREVAGQHRTQLEAMMKRYYHIRAESPPAAKQKGKQGEKPVRRRSRD